MPRGRCLRRDPRGQRVVRHSGDLGATRRRLGQPRHDMRARRSQVGPDAARAPPRSPPGRKSKNGYALSSSPGSNRGALVWRRPAWIRNRTVGLPRRASSSLMPSGARTSSVRGRIAGARDSWTRSAASSTTRTEAALVVKEGGQREPSRSGAHRQDVRITRRRRGSGRRRGDGHVLLVRSPRTSALAHSRSCMICGNTSGRANARVVHVPATPSASTRTKPCPGSSSCITVPSLPVGPRVRAVGQERRRSIPKRSRSALMCSAVFLLHGVHRNHAAPGPQTR